jgi:hypothetical protein
MTTPTLFPLRGQAVRMQMLRAVLLPLDTGNMAIAALVTACENAVPDATIEEIADALQQVAAEHMADAERCEAELQRRRYGNTARGAAFREERSARRPVPEGSGELTAGAVSSGACGSTGTKA